MPSENKDKLDKNASQPSGNIDMSVVPFIEPEEGALRTYSNVINLDWTLFDVRMRFAELIQVPREDNPIWTNQETVLLERAVITIPWQQAKALSGMLAAIVQNYEDLNGELKQVALPAMPTQAPTT